MHRCLAIPEILYAICKVIRDEPVFASKGYLAALARTCRTFQEPALDNLWYELRDLRPLILCLPREAWRYLDSEGSRRRFLTLTRGLTKSDIQTIQRHGQRVRVIHIIGSYACGVEASTLQIIDLLPRPLLPNVRQLAWLHVPKDIFHHLRLFLGKQLVSLEISISELEAVQTTLINLMPSLLSPPILRRLHIRAKGDFDKEPVRFSLLAPNFDWSALRTLALPGSAVEGIVQIGDLPNLQEFTLGGPLVTDGPYELECSVAGSFASLRVLNLEDHPVIITRWLPLFRNAKLVELFMHSFTDLWCSDKEWSILFMKMGENVDHGSLQRLSIQFCNLNVPPSLRSSDILPPLLCFTELRTFSFILKGSLALSHGETLALTNSWSNITSVHFTPTSLEPNRYSKLSSLALWAKNCPKLERLHLSVDAGGLGDRLDLLSRLAVTPEFNAIHSSLSTLDVGNSPITHKEFVALFLLKIFPNLKRIHASQTGRRRWSKVAFLMSLMKASRDTSSQTLKGDGTDPNLHDWWADGFSNYGGGSQSDEESDG